MDVSYYTLFTCVGAIVSTIKLANFGVLLFVRILHKIREKFGSNVWQSLGKWAVVTGGTDGIGKAYAEQLARKGFNICLISRNMDKLQSVAKDLEEKFAVSTKIINVDFTGGPEIYKEIKSELEQIEDGIGVLVNNVGMSYKYCEYFHMVPEGREFMWDLINSNVTSCTMMMKTVMPLMKKGIIINISSLMALYPMPLLATYAACKAYVDYLSRATQYEFKKEGILIQCVLPAYVSTKMSARRRNIEIPTAEEFVESAIKTVGVENRTCGYLPHKIRGFVHEWLKANMPARFNLWLSMHYMKKAREGYYRRLKKQLSEIDNVPTQ